MIKFGTQLNAFGKIPRVDALKQAKSYGCDVLEVGLSVDGLRTGTSTLDELLIEAGQIRDDFAAAGIGVANYHPNLMLKHGQLPHVIKAAAQIAKIIGSAHINLTGSPHVRWGGPNSKLDEWYADFDGTHDSNYWIKRNTKELATLLDITANDTVRFCFELHHGYVANSASGIMRILQDFPVSRVGVNMDPGNMVIEGNEGWRNGVQIIGPYMAYLHCKNAGFRRENGKWSSYWTSLEDGIADFPQIVTALKDIGFDGALLVEDLRRDLSIDERVGNGVKYLKSLVQSPVRVMPW